MGRHSSIVAVPIGERRRNRKRDLERLLDDLGNIYVFEDTGRYA